MQAKGVKLASGHQATCYYSRVARATVLLWILVFTSECLLLIVYWRCFLPWWRWWGFLASILETLPWLHGTVFAAVMAVVLIVGYDRWKKTTGVNVWIENGNCVFQYEHQVRRVNVRDVVQVRSQYHEVGCPGPFLLSRLFLEVDGREYEFLGLLIGLPMLLQWLGRSGRVEVAEKARWLLTTPGFANAARYTACHAVSVLVIAAAFGFCDYLAIAGG